MARAALPEFRHYRVALLILRTERINIGVRHLVHDLDQIADPMGINRHPESQLCLDLVTLGHCNLSHIIPKTDNLELLKIGPSCCGP
ncbi:MAG: hypothetical protein BWY82_01730 [Verrucomicrobia bacterium ADurb.Bin474]|nr:MAG: hypothetical protein BWY82_01730 [Verrucomicrobia bacterium ADurb.Bin474]